MRARGDAYAVINPTKLQFVGAAFRLGKPAPFTERIGAMALKLTRSLRKFSFDEGKHPRGPGGKFSSKGVAPSGASTYEHQSGFSAAQRRRNAVRIVQDHSIGLLQRPRGEGRPADTLRRSMVRNSSVWSRVNRIPEGMPGHEPAELPVGSFKEHVVAWQKPKALTQDEHNQVVQSLVDIIKSNREGAIATGAERGYIPENTPRHSIVRAYHHGAMHAMHAFGVLDYHAKMDDALKEEMKPLEPFIRFSERRLRSQMLGEQKGKWRPYRAEFGQKFPTPKYDRATGEERLRVRPNQVLIKSEALGLSGPKNPLVLPPQPGLSRFDRYRKAIATDEMQGRHETKPLTPKQRQQRLKAGIAERMKVRTGVQLKPGMPGSLAGLKIKPQANPLAVPSAPHPDGLAPGQNQLAAKIGLGARA